MTGWTLLLGLLLSGFFAVACMRSALPRDGEGPIESPRDLLRFPGRLERLRRSRWQWFAMVALMIVLRLQQQLPVVLELMAAVQFLLFLALPTSSPGRRRALSHLLTVTRARVEENTCQGGGSMAATKSQGSYFGVFLVGTTLIRGGLATIGTGIGKLMLLAGAVVFLASLAGFLKIKPLEGKTPLERSPETMKWIGAGVALFGWLVTIGGLRIVEGNGGRIVVALLGIGVSLFGMLYVLPAVFNRTAFWKAPAGAKPGLTPLAGKTTVEPSFASTSHAMESAR